MRRSRFLLLYGAAWFAIACLFAVLIPASTMEPIPAPIAVLTGVSDALPAALLGLVAWRLATRMAEREWSALRLLATHALLALVYAAAWTGSVVAIIATTSPSALPFFMRMAFGWQLLMAGLFYAVLAGIAHGRAVTLRNHELEAAAARAEMLRIHAELRALRARLDPHFLFNTLHSIMALVRTDPAAGEDALERLGDLLRRVLTLNREPVEELPLADELDFTRDFLALEMFRLGDRLTVIEDVDPDVLDCLLPVLTLQPLVENAIRHAIAPRTAGGTLRLAARLEQDTLCVEVEDGGPGLPAARPDAGGIDAGRPRQRHGEETLGPRAANDRAGEPTRAGTDAATADAPGIGIRLVRQRLEARHGRAARLDLLPGDAGGLRARITLPARTIPVHALAEAP